MGLLYFVVFFFKQKTAYEMRISDWSSDVCSSDLEEGGDELADLIDSGAEGRGQDQHAEPPDLGRQLRQPQAQLQPLATHRPPEIGELRDPGEADRDGEDDRDDPVVVTVAAQPPAEDDARNQQDVEQHRRERPGREARSEENTSELQSLMRISYAAFSM